MFNSAEYVLFPQAEGKTAELSLFCSLEL